MSKIRIASINLQRGIKTRTALERWLDAWKPDVLLVQEPCEQGHAPPPRVGEYKLLGGNGYVSAYACGTRGPAPAEHVGDRIQVLRVNRTTVFNAYFPSKSPGPRMALFQQLSREVSERAPANALVFGDFNMAPRPQDGRFGDDESTWTGAGERSAFQDLLKSRGLVDVYAEGAPTAEPFTFERVNRGKTNRFRCDLVLASRKLCGPGMTTLNVDHETRLGSARFTDHSALVLDATI